MNGNWVRGAVVAAVAVLGVAAHAQTPAKPPVLSTVPTLPAGAVTQPVQMSGLPIQVGDLPPGIVTVRVIRGSFAENVVNERVELRVAQSGRVMEAATDDEGRARFSGLSVGETVTAHADVTGEALTSQPFAIPSEGGVRLVLVATAIAATETVASAHATAPRATSSRSLSRPNWIASVLFVIAFLGLAGSIVRSARRHRTRPRKEQA